jgi:two-component system sensor histidine kinase/response regulator
MKQVFRVLVTDDEEGMRLGTKRALDRYVAHFDDMDAEVSYEIDVAASGEEALERIAERQPDLLLLDYKLPGISGLDVLERIREAGLETITVMITAYASLETAITATKQGAFDFLPKPFTPQEVRAATRKATSQLLLLREAKRLAEEKRRVRFEFITVLSHELKAPLNAVESYLNLMKDGTATADPADFARAVDRSIARIQGMRKLIFDLIDMTRIESGTKVRSLAEADLGELARAAVDGFAAMAAERRIDLIVDAPDAVPFPVDRAEIEIVLNNLVSNAIKYNRDGGRVTVRVAPVEGDGARIDVADTGIGMTSQAAAKLFADFVRIRNEKTLRIEGSGLGLSTVAKIAALYGGNATVTSTPDVGSTFSVTLVDLQTSEKPRPARVPALPTFAEAGEKGSVP